MTTQHIEILQEEANRLLALEIGILKDMLNTEGVLTDSKAGEVQTFDSVNTPKAIEILEGEQKKLEGLEMVIAIVGTMKAGKSTTINAIVGTEVLPNRNRPMTAIPTLIEHTSGQTEPVLEFKNKAPIERLTKELREALDYLNNKAIVEELGKDRDMKELIDFIRSQSSYESSYLGANAIFGFLKGLNDLVRLSKELDLEFPFSDYDEIHEIPVIKVEFVHLRETEQAHGKLTLLDTPGPNESGQPHLRKMLKDQLAKASAVLAVLDFTQLKSEADAQVREDLKAIASVSEGRLYTLVNKFDNRDRHSDNAEQVKAFVANTLMEQSIPESHVFPVSSRYGYLANRARHELFMNQQLPDHEIHRWVEDFGSEAFGTRWQKKISDIKATKDAADDLWEESLFHDPLEQVIKTAHQNAALLAIDSAAAKLHETSKKIGNFLSLRETSLSKSTQELRDEIASLMQDVERIKTTEDNAKNSAKATLQKLKNETNSIFKKTNDDLKTEINRYFKEGKSIEKKAYQDYAAKKRHEEEEKQKRRSDRKEKLGAFGGILNAFAEAKDFARQNGNTPITHFDPESPTIKFEEISKAQDLINKISDTASSTIKIAEQTMLQSMTNVVNVFQTEFLEITKNDVKRITDEMEKRLKNSGFSISLPIPDIAALTIKSSGSEILSNLIDEKQETVTNFRRKSGTWGTLCKWLKTDDWGWESYETKQKYYEVDVNKIKQLIDRDVNKVFDGLGHAVTEKIRDPLENGIQEFFAKLEKIIKELQGDLRDNIQGKENNKINKENFAKQLAALRKHIHSIGTDSAELIKDIQKENKISIKETV